MDRSRGRKILQFRLEGRKGYEILLVTKHVPEQLSLHYIVKFKPET